MEKQQLKTARKTLGEVFRDRREGLGKTHEEVAARININGVSSATIKAVEHGRYIFTMEFFLL